MAKEKEATLSKDERKALKRAEKEKKRSDSDGVHKSKDKKDKKKERAALKEKVANAVESGEVVMAARDEGKEKETEVVMKSDAEDEKEEKDTKKKLAVRPIGALVPFANPLADEKVAKKVFKGVKKAAASKSLKRGVKEVVKALRKSPTTPSSPPPGVVVLAADISPMDVISHIPVLCEDHSIPYIYVTSRAELGMAGQTKRPTSVVMVTESVGGKARKEGEKEKDEEGQGDWKEAFAGLVKVVEREGRHVKI